jgi:hypothetical protein
VNRIDTPGTAVGEAAAKYLRLLHTPSALNVRLTNVFAAERKNGTLAAHTIASDEGGREDDRVRVRQQVPFPSFPSLFAFVSRSLFPHDRYISSSQSILLLCAVVFSPLHLFRRTLCLQYAQHIQHAPSYQHRVATGVARMRVSSVSQDGTCPRSTFLIAFSFICYYFYIP